MSSQSKENNLTVVTLHDCAPAFSKRIFECTDAIENLDINFNVRLIQFYRHTENLPRYPDFVEKIKAYKQCEIVLNGLYHEDNNDQTGNFHTKSKSVTEEELSIVLSKKCNR